MRPMLMCAAILAAIAAPTPATAAPDAAAGNFLKLGDVKGETMAAARGKEKWIEIQGWDFGTRKGWDGTIKGGSMKADAPARHDVKSPRDSASGMPTGKRQHDWRPSPHSLEAGGSVRIKVKFPWVGCTVGDRVAGATIGSGDKAYELTDLTIAACATDEVILDYAKVKVRGWDPIKKEEIVGTVR